MAQKTISRAAAVGPFLNPQELPRTANRLDSASPGDRLCRAAAAAASTKIRTVRGRRQQRARGTGDRVTGVTRLRWRCATSGRATVLFLNSAGGFQCLRLLNLSSERVSAFTPASVCLLRRHRPNNGARLPTFFSFFCSFGELPVSSFVGGPWQTSPSTLELHGARQRRS